MTTTKLTDLQTSLLMAASGRDGGSLLPLPATMTMSTGLRRSLASLIARGLIEETATAVDEATWRIEGGQRFGIVVTDAGRTAIGAPVLAAATLAVAPDTPTTKITLVTNLLRRPDGATVAELIAATGWLPHTTRAALTGLRKKGHSIDKATRDGATTYLIAAA